MHSRASGLRRVGPALALLLVLGLALTALRAAQPLHRHHGATLGVYNEEHVLAALDSTISDVPLPVGQTSIALDLVPATPQLPAGARPPAPAARLTDSRAPPLT
jgi:hypothetical protein